jgi:hypothetical protein
LLPTAAMASLPTKRPMMMMSMALKSCWQIPVTARSMAKETVLSPIDPWSMSIFLIYP